jgi:hypothetical protein
LSNGLLSGSDVGIAFLLGAPSFTVLHEGPPAAGEHAFTLCGAGLHTGICVVRATGRGLDFTRHVTLVR